MSIVSPIIPAVGSPVLTQRAADWRKGGGGDPIVAVPQPSPGGSSLDVVTFPGTLAIVQGDATNDWRAPSWAGGIVFAIDFIYRASAARQCLYSNTFAYVTILPDGHVEVGRGAFVSPEVATSTQTLVDGERYIFHGIYSATTSPPTFMLAVNGVGWSELDYLSPLGFNVTLDPAQGNLVSGFGGDLRSGFADGLTSDVVQIWQSVGTEDLVTQSSAADYWDGQQPIDLIANPPQGDTGDYAGRAADLAALTNQGTQPAFGVVGTGSLTVTSIGGAGHVSHPLYAKIAIVYNSDVPASQQIAEYYAGVYGIPLSNLWGFAFGTAPQSVSQTVLTFADFWTPLRNHMESIPNCSGVLCAAGVPNRITNVTPHRIGKDPGVIHLPALIPYAQAVYADGVEPASNDASGGQWLAYLGSEAPSAFSPLFSQIIPSVWAASDEVEWQDWVGITHAQNDANNWVIGRQDPDADYSHVPADLLAFVTADGKVAADIPGFFYDTYYTPALRDLGDYSATRVRLCGVIGPWSDNWSSWPADLFDQAKRIIDDGLATARRSVSDLTAYPVVWGIGAAGGDNDFAAPAFYDAWGPRQLNDAGWDWSKLRLWDGGYSYSSGTLSKRVVPEDKLNVGNPAALKSQPFIILGGGGLRNDGVATYGTATEESTFSDGLKPARGAVSIGGRSASHDWAAEMVRQGAVAAVGAWIHETGGNLRWPAQAVYHLLRGFSIAEIAMFAGARYFCIGDPLFRMVEPS